MPALKAGAVRGDFTRAETSEGASAGRKALQLEARGGQSESQAPGDPVTETGAGELLIS